MEEENKMYDFVVLFESETGNTEIIASAIYSALPSDNCILLDIKKQRQIPDAKMYFIGFGVHKGTCSIKVVDVLEQITGRRVAFFVTCGSTVDEKVKNSLINEVKVWLEDEEQFAGMYLCQGRLTEEVLEKYKDISKEQIGNKSQLQKMEELINELQKHPDQKDCEDAVEFVYRIIKENEYNYY